MGRVEGREKGQRKPTVFTTHPIHNRETPPNGERAPATDSGPKAAGSARRQDDGPPIIVAHNEIRRCEVRTQEGSPYLTEKSSSAAAAS
ncbi:hypothetical protein KM043_014165 [Ampulex compressa]|nr:hypothetical protein KM043_014165 [Ampulex compressa]